MQRIACYTAMVLFSMIGLVGCSSGWTFANWRESLAFNKPSTRSNQSISELRTRAEQLERVQEYDVAAELYGQILKQDHNNQFAAQRLTAIQRLKHGLSGQNPNRMPIRESMPVSRDSSFRQQDLPRIKPGASEQSRSVAIREQPNRTRTTLEHRENAPGHASMAIPAWADSAKVEREESIAVSQQSKKRVPLDQFMARAVETDTTDSHVRRKVQPAGVIQLPAVYDAQTIRANRNSTFPQSHVAQVSMTTILPKIVQPQSTTTLSEEYTLIDVQKRLSTHPADPSAIETLVQGFRTEDRVGRWEISSTLGVLVQIPDSKSLIMDSLSRALVDREPEMRRNATLASASLGSNALELLPALEKRLNDNDESVRTAAAYAIGAIR